MGEIKEISIITRRENEKELQERLSQLDIKDLSVIQVKGCGIEEGILKYSEDGKEMVMLIPKVKLVIRVKAELVEEIIEIAIEECRTGMVGDGKIFIENTTQVYE